MITQQYIKSILNYCQDTGTFTWKINRGSNKVKGFSAGHIHKTTGYVSITIDKKFNAAHRLAWLYMTGSFPENEIDHINQDKADNRWINLRDVTTSENLKNKKLRSDNKSGISGVYFDKPTKKWEVRIRCDNKNHYFGRYTDKEKAIEIRDEAIKGFDFSDIHGRF